MDTDIFEQFPDRETFDKYWNENYQPVTYEDVREAFTDFVKSADGHIYLSDYEEKGLISREDFKENLSQEAQFTFEDGLTEVFTIRIRSFTRRRSRSTRSQSLPEKEMHRWRRRFTRRFARSMQSFWTDCMMRCWKHGNVRNPAEHHSGSAEVSF